MKEKGELRRLLDQAQAAYRVAQRESWFGGAWLRCVRHATGVPVKEIARRMGKTEHEVWRMEAAEGTWRIELATLRRGAEALGCDLVYALVPKQGSIEDMARKQREAVETRRKEAREARRQARAKRFREAGGVEALKRALRASLRKEFGIRVRGLARRELPEDLRLACTAAGRSHRRWDET